MYTNMRKQACRLLLLLLAVAPIGAGISANGSGGAFSPEKGLDLSGSFEAQREAILKALGDGETYVEIAPENRQAVKGSLARISNLLGGAQSVDQLSEGAKVEVFNEQEKINNLLTEAREDSRLQCSRERPTGSHRPKTICKTVAERRLERDRAQDSLRYRFQPEAKPPGSP